MPRPSPNGRPSSAFAAAPAAPELPRRAPGARRAWNRDAFGNKRPFICRFCFADRPICEAVQGACRAPSVPAITPPWRGSRSRQAARLGCCGGGGKGRWRRPYPVEVEEAAAIPPTGATSGLRPRLADSPSRGE
ncbi:MAG: hypothetical protein OXU61_05525 [Gammaproteobacteria bacterium]|nr:hypothetical protein [Gammaproteobacteria bacterium]